MFAEATRLGKAVELDATPARQDLTVELATIAREEGVEWFDRERRPHGARARSSCRSMATAALAEIPSRRILNYRPVEFVREWARGNGSDRRAM